MKVDNTVVSSWYLAGSHAVMASAVCQTAMQLWRLQCANYHRSLAPTVSSILLSAQNSASSVLTAKVDHKIISTAQQTPTYLQQQNGWTVFCAYCEIVGSQKSEFISVWWHPCSEEHPGKKNQSKKRLHLWWGVCLHHSMPRRSSRRPWIKKPHRPFNGIGQKKIDTQQFFTWFLVLGLLRSNVW